MKSWTRREKQMNKQKYPKLQANGKSWLTKRLSYKSTQKATEGSSEEL